MFARKQTLAVAAAGSLALFGVAVGTASASGAETSASASATGSCVTGGTGTILMSGSYINYFLAKYITVHPASPAWIQTLNKFDPTSPLTKYTNQTYNATGGDADLSATAGTVHYSGGIEIEHVVTGKRLLFPEMTFDATHNQVFYTLRDAVIGPDGTAVGGARLGTVLPVFNLGGPVQRTVHGNTVSYDSSALLMTATAANALNAYYGINAFHEGDDWGPGFHTTYTTGPCA